MECPIGVTQPNPVMTTRFMQISSSILGTLKHQRRILPAEADKRC